MSAVTENEYGAYGKYGKNTEKPGSFLGLSYLGDNGWKEWTKKRPPLSIVISINRWEKLVMIYY